MKICTEKEPALKPLKAVTVSGQKWNDYMSREKTGAIKGIFVLMVFFSHFCTCYKSGIFIDSFPKTLFSKYIGQLMVAMFLFYSGYGITESVKRKGKNYVRNMPVQRILKLLFDFDIAVLIYLIADIIIGKSLKTKTILLSFIAWESLGNSCWYIFAILCLYIFSYVAFRVSGKNYKLAPLIVTVLTGVYCVLIKGVKEDPWFNTVICYAFGMWFSLLREKVENVIQHSFWTWTLSLAVCAGVFAFAYFNRVGNLVMYEISCLAFVMCVVILSMKVSFNNFVLRKAGEMIFGVYILQRLPMMLLSRNGFLGEHLYVSFLICIACTGLLAVGFNYFTKLTAKLFDKFRIKKHA